MDCGDNSCMFAPKKGGMRTNGGCRCLKSIDDAALRREIQRAFMTARADGYRAGIEDAARVVEITGDVPVVKLGRIMDRIRALAPAKDEP